MIVIGIDPAFRKSGFAMCIIDEDRTVAFKVFVRFLDFIKWCFSDDSPKGENVYFVIENSNLQNLTFNMKGNKGEIARHSRNVGANQAVSQNTVDLCRDIWGRENVVELSPLAKGKKWTAQEAFFFSRANNHILNLKGIDAEEDKRDAYKLCTMLPQSLLLRKSLSK